eukprot:scaffold347_cov380-Prasinococcus_capsulatus_cf.AAC.6
MAIQVADTLHLEGLAVQLNLMGLHDFLDGRPDVAQPNVDASLPDARVGRLLHGLQQWVILRIECDREGAVNDPTPYLGAKIKLHDVIILQNSLVTSIRCPMRSHPIQRASGGECNARAAHHRRGGVLSRFRAMRTGRGARRHCLKRDGLWLRTPGHAPQ